nr:immunoglobulin light chain junction region [Macaca mulatta]
DYYCQVYDSSTTILF